MAGFYFTSTLFAFFFRKEIRLVAKARFIPFLNSSFRSEYNHGFIPDEENAISSTHSHTERICRFKQ